MLTLLLLAGLARAEDDEFITVEGDEAAARDPFSGTPYGFGVGVIAGAPSGISLGWRPSERHTINGALAWSLTSEQVHMHADYLITVYGVRAPDAPGLLFSVATGLGVRVRAGGQVNDESLGVRVPLHFMVLPDKYPVDAFVEFVPWLSVYPDTLIRVDAALGARFFFGSIE